MQPPSFLPSRPPTTQANSAQAAALALRSALTNPYSQAYSSHYAQAYMQQFNQTPLRNTEGYTISSAYHPNVNAAGNSQPAAGPSFSRPQQNNGGVRLKSFAHANSTWYQPGRDMCPYKGCSFTGSAKSVEIHMMDRHLIYPPGWDKKKPEWDADPSLKGKAVPIQGTNVVLNTPDAIDAWIGERKKRWPSSVLIAEKKRKFEASARGELSVESLGLFSKKKRRIQGSSEGNDRTDRSRSGRGRGRGLSDSGWRGRGPRVRGGGHSGAPEHTKKQANPPEQMPAAEKQASDNSNSDSDSEPEVLSSKPPQSFLDEQMMDPPESTLANQSNKIFKKPYPQPKRPPYNPFAPRSNLLRNLLLPEISMTVSNLSQAIRFLVDNNFLDGVELNPGEANANLIQVVSSETANEASPSLSGNLLK
ncbi:hypothetical protein GYMLUDRAFT_314137 [Collybiopsis luxurians FD-317 M1]|nr:hypothetical protein GYMLUDRAFT_314137 [Collybiopsis luxurians FD-317 M1]